MLDFSQLLTFTIASAIIILSPGADSFVLLRISHSQGIKAGMRALWGINLGNTSQALLMISGVGLIVSKFEPAILALKILGGLYMAYLAFMAARAAWQSRSDVDSAGAADSSTSPSGEAARVKHALVLRGNRELVVGSRRYQDASAGQRMQREHRTHADLGRARGQGTDASSRRSCCRDCAGTDRRGRSPGG